MSLPPPESPILDQTEEEQAAIKALVDSYAKSNLHDAQEDPSKADPKDPSKPRPMRKYTREQLLRLYRSPLVQLPPHMPELKQWFGDNEILLSKKESDLNSNGRGRFRREPDDGDASSRPPFRSTLSQPSQMGNFKHQSLRSGDRERDGDRDREIRDKEGLRHLSDKYDRDRLGMLPAYREIRDKEGLRHLSDKYDRDRLGMLPASARGKERESAPHLNVNSSRTSSQNQSSATSRRADGRESQKKRPGESGDDWRRNESSRTGRDDRDDRERARSRPRETSRSRRSPSRPRRERDDGRDRPSRSDRDRDDYRRDDYRRERDADRDQDDDPRRWRDDGKRDERMAARRAERDRELRTRERGDHWEPSSDRRWTPADERDGRYKRTSGRDRKSGGNGDELKDRDDRREREREKEKEPAWMETYVPTSNSGILGGKSTNGELDGIQAWKKGLKEKELQERTNDASESVVSASQESEKGLDEIQIFKMLMKREEEKKKLDSSPSSPGPDTSTDVKLVANNAGEISNQPPPSIQPHPSSSTTNIDSGIISPPSRDSVSKTVALDESSPSQFPEKPTEYNPPAGSRLLALGRTSGKSPVNPLSVTGPNGLTVETTVKPGTPRSQDFSPFEEQIRSAGGDDQLAVSGQYDLAQRPSDKSYNLIAPSNTYDDNNGLAYAGNRGSRFAKFFDSKTKENPPPGLKPQTPTGFISSSPNPPLRQEPVMYGGGPPPNNQERTMEELFAMLNNSSQAQRANLLNHPTPHHPLNNGHLLNQANIMNNPPSQSSQLQSNSRIDALYDSRLDDRFVPDGMVPGLRTAPPRSRDNMGLYPEGGYNPNNGRNTQLPLQQAQFRGGPSPGVGPPNPLPSLQHQRLPPGLANLGGRPPHDPTQILGLTGHPNAPLHANLMPQQQQSFNNFPPSSFNNPQTRGPIPNLHHLQNTGPQPGLGHMALGNNMDPRSQNLAGQLLGSPGAPGLPGQRGGNSAIFNPQQMTSPQGPLYGGRQPQHLPPQVPPHLMPPQFSQGVNGPNGGHTNELIALLMGGAPRE
ncbi:hypothetical protein AN958_04874 [Leucoagaricus sp. SymC.cos]|nr:hypothetical protein AN958_04874 [Leucoagaricus sp. SymC.cos]